MTDDDRISELFDRERIQKVEDVVAGEPGSRYDPNFPDRPQHDDFWMLSQAVRTNDDYVSEGHKTIREVMMMAEIDPESLIYMANQRAARMIKTLTAPDDAKNLVANMAAVWIDAFLAGLKMGDWRSERPEIPTEIVLNIEDGQHRGRP